MKRFLLAGISHKTAPVEWRERLAVPEERLPALLAALRRAPGVTEAVVLSTCNRVEAYAAAEGDGARAALEAELAGVHGDPRVAGSFYAEQDEAAVRHLFRVSAGLESLVVGESEILGQVKRAYETARTNGATGKLTNVVFQRALYVGKLTRARTGISEGPTSTASLAVALAEKIFGDLRESRVLLVGAGKMAELSARALLGQKVAELVVVNRTFEKAREMAALFRGRAVPFEKLGEQLESADIVICSTGSPAHVISAEDVAGAMRRRRGRSLFLIDIAVPRDVDPGVHKVENVYLYNIDDLQSLVAETLARRQGRIELAGDWVNRKTEEFAAWYRAWREGGSATLVHSSGDLVPDAASPDLP